MHGVSKSFAHALSWKSPQANRQAASKLNFDLFIIYHNINLTVKLFQSVYLDYKVTKDLSSVGNT